MRQSAITFQTKGLNFEGVVATPDEADGKAPGDKYPGVVICHPHPLFGGNMDNNVVLAVAFELVERGFAVLRFNFRGVGNSEGEHTKGEKEYEEALGALDFMRAWEQVDGDRLGILGYSFGTGVILGSSSLQKRPKVFAFVSPSIERLKSTPLQKDKRPKFIITGNRDKLAGAEGLQDVLDSFVQPPEFHVIDGADHFWMGLESQMVPLVSRFFLENLK